MDEEKLSDIPVTITVELGTTELTLREVRKLDKTVELDQSADDPVRLKVRDRVIAHGELVTIDDHYGVRITEMLL